MIASRTVVLAVALVGACVLWSVPGHADEETIVSPHPSSSDPITSEIPLLWPAGSLNPKAYHLAARRRVNTGGFFIVSGSIGFVVGSALMLGELARKPYRGEELVWSKTGCTLSFSLASIFVPLGLHLLTRGIATVMRGKTLEDLASAMESSGPSAIWRQWYDVSRSMRVAGNVITLAGSLLISVSMLTSLPKNLCEKWQCQGWPDEYGAWGGWDINKHFGIGIVIGVFGGALTALGIALLAVGTARQKKFQLDNGLTATDTNLSTVSLSVSPSGLTMKW